MVPSGGASAGQLARRFRVGGVPPLAEGFTDRPDTAPGIVEALAPGLAVVLVPGSAFAESPQNWLGACGKTQLAVSLAESLWQSGAINALIWIAATSRAAVLSAYAQAYMAGTGIEPAGTAESVAARFVSWLGTTSQPWLVVLDDLQDPADLDGLWPEGPEGRLLVTSRQSTLVSGRPGMRVVPVEFFSVREALSYLTGRLSADPVQRNGAIELIEDLGREPLALAQAVSVVANSTLTCRDYREYFAHRWQQVGVVAGEAGSAAMVTWTLSVGQAESLLPGESVRLMLVIVALLDGHGIPGAIFDTPAVRAYLGAAAAPVSPAVGLKLAWDALLAIERAGMITIDRAETPPTFLMSSVLAAAIRLAAPAQLKDPAARAAASALLEAWPAEESQPWTAARLRANAASLQNSAADVLWTGGCHPLLLRAGRSLDGARLIGPAVEYWRDLASRCDTKLSPGHPDALAVAGQLAAAYLAAGQAGKAVTWYRRVLTERGHGAGARAPRHRRSPRQPGPGAPHGGRARRCGVCVAAGRQRMRAFPRARPSRYLRRPGGTGRRTPCRGRGRGGDPAAGAHADRPQAPAGPAPRGHHDHPGPPSRGLPGRRQDQGRRLAVQARARRPRAHAWAQPSGHDRDSRRARRRLPHCRTDTVSAGALRAVLRGFEANPRSRPRGHANPPGKPGPPVLHRGPDRRRASPVS